MATRNVLALLLTAALACAPTESDQGLFGEIRGEVPAPPGGRGDAYLFLHDRPAPAERDYPFRITAVPDERIAAGDRTFVIAQVPPNPYNLRGFIDVGLDFEPTIDVLSQPTFGDRLFAGTDLNLQPGGREQLSLRFSGLPLPDPPAFEVEGQNTLVELPDSALALTTFRLIAHPVPPLQRSAIFFRVKLIDANGDRQPDDDNGDGIPDLFPSILLRFKPRPGQTLPTNERGDLLEVVLPLLFEPGPFLSLLGGSVDEAVEVQELSVAVVPQPFGLSFHPIRGRELTPLAAIPPGEYELFVLQDTGQYWKLPNALGVEDPTQALRFEVVRR